MIKRLLRFLSRIPVRLLAFNLLLVFLPVAGVLYLGAFEARLESAEVRAMTEEARIVATVLSQERELDAIVIDELLHRIRSGSVRFRVIDRDGDVIADSREVVITRPRGSPRHNTLYRIAAFVARPFVRLIRPPEQPLDVDVAAVPRLSGPEVRAALNGHEGFDKKISAGGQRSVTLYRTVPLRVDGRIAGAVVASASTYPILQDLYVIRLRVLRIFVISVVLAILISIFYSTTIVKPLRQLRVDARSILDRRGRLRGHFKGSDRLDEIGELSRALERITRRLDSHVKSMEHFAADVSHEFKNPLASIRMANEMLGEVTEPADRKRFARMVEQEVSRMETMLSGVREISLIDAQLDTEERRRIDVGELLGKIVDGFRMRERARVVFLVDAANEPLIVDAAEDRLIQVFENLLDNAVSFSPDGGTVRVRILRDGRSIVTEVRDEGPGIPTQHLDRIFDRFFTYRPATPRHAGRHTGLGLGIARAIVDGYGGTIGAANGEQGAVFTVRLPVSGEAEGARD